ncbi:hypothetical protein R3P38DRAFT_3195519 [Favolaschia claudopus]|uniref:Uncharacterized protein n=1 Tax=Favolaschia claudopus TaxID=2862362 RepID=A0AAW0B7A7_9AGAR
MSTPPPPSGYARSSQVLRFSCLLFLVLRSGSTSIYLWGPSWRDVEPFPSASPSCGRFPLLIAVLEGSQAAHHLRTLGRRLSDVGSLLARDDDGALVAVQDWNASVNVSVTRAAIYFLAECTSQATPAFYPSRHFYIYFGIQARDASLRVEFYTSSQWDIRLFGASCSPSSMGILLRMRRSLLGHWGSAEEFPIASESPWGWALSRFPSTIQTESASVIHKLTFSP